jgi:lysophospholipase L1-like esterase
MSAKNGSTGSFRSRGRLIGIAMAAVFAMSALFAANASASKTVSSSYLALGDSLAFGYSQQLYNENEKAGDPATAFEAGYVADYYAKIKHHLLVQEQNLGCPGETSASLIGNGAVGAALKASSFAATNAAPCGYSAAWNGYHKPGLGGPLHIEYGGAKSQLEKALELIAVDAAEKKPVEAITFNIGANDQLAAIHACEAEVKTEFETEGKSKYGATPAIAGHECIVAHVPGLIGSIIKNTEAAAFALRSGAFNGVPYAGKIIVQNGYDPYGAVFVKNVELLEGSLGLAGLINAHEKEAYEAPAEFGGFAPCIADIYSTFNPKDKSEPARLQAYTNMANATAFEGKPNGPDIHPTPAGYLKIASLMKKQCG